MDSHKSARFSVTVTPESIGADLFDFLVNTGRKSRGTHMTRLLVRGWTIEKVIAGAAVFAGATVSANASATPQPINGNVPQKEDLSALGSFFVGLFEDGGVPAEA